MTANDSKSYLPYLNKLVYQYNNTYHHSINKNLINADFSVLTEKIETNTKARKFNDRVRITKFKNIFCFEFFCFCFDSFLKTNLWTYKIKDTNGEKIIGSFYEKEFFLRIL